MQKIINCKCPFKLLNVLRCNFLACKKAAKKEAKKEAKKKAKKTAKKKTE